MRRAHRLFCSQARRSAKRVHRRSSTATVLELAGYCGYCGGKLGQLAVTLRCLESQAVSWEGFAPVHAAAAYGRVSVMHMLLTFGADAKAAGPNGVRTFPPTPNPNPDPEYEPEADPELDSDPDTNPSLKPNPNFNMKFNTNPKPNTNFDLGPSLNPTMTLTLALTMKPTPGFCCQTMSLFPPLHTLEEIVYCALCLYLRLTPVGERGRVWFCCTHGCPCTFQAEVKLLMRR